jgi:hypothetical protein
VADPLLPGHKVQQSVEPHEREAFEAARAAEIAALERLLRDAIAPAVEAVERVRRAIGEVDAALRGEFEPETS